MKLTKKQAIHMVDAIRCGGFGVYGLGNFDISNEDIAELLVAAFDRNRYKKCSTLYDELYSKYMR